MTELLEINRQTVYLTIDNVRIETENGIEEKDNQFVAYVKYERPNEFNFGEEVKNESEENILFNSQDNARNFVIERLKRTIYPPDFFNPLDYTKENLDELMHKELIYDIGTTNSDTNENTIEGVMTECSLAANPPHLPDTATILTNDGEYRNFDFFEIKRIRRN